MWCGNCKKTSTYLQMFINNWYSSDLQFSGSGTTHLTVQTEHWRTASYFMVQVLCEDEICISVKAIDQLLDM